MSKERVAKIRKVRGDDMKKFALDLERELYAGEPEELAKNVDKRVESVDKVEFIKECVFMFYGVHDSAKRTTRAAIKNTLNSRIRKHRRSSSLVLSKNRAPYSPDPFLDDTNLHF
ncbi:unnamed protein product [Heligmosomoides polygyrus]|uniref:Transcription and mRNA export factor ENY2 n=1 Tax=Heligmosomoides polygyrus TaxID=6339 RepID=A0A183FV09_HELPZ|nr:unnamed protein product [Heligmosomoides polygyrus]